MIKESKQLLNKIENINFKSDNNSNIPSPRFQSSSMNFGMANCAKANAAHGRIKGVEIRQKYIAFR
ncbi:MAG: hypothetical protein WBM09_13410 [Gallionella sp.]